jgi:hypothetical protein
MMTWSINLFVLATGFLIVGMYKPQLLLFWMDKPKRMPIVLFSGFLFMVGATMFGEANREKKTWLEEQAQKTSETIADNVPTVIEETVKVEIKKETETETTQ